MTNRGDLFMLYRFFAADDTLLYIGLTVNPGRRLDKHRATQPWWPDVARVELERFPDHQTLRAAEREAIEAEKPLHNIRMNGVTIHRGIRVVWPCHVCASPVEDGDGYLTVSYREIFAYQDAQEAFDEMLAERARENDSIFAGFVLSEMPDVEPARWTALHRWCDPEPESNDYHFAIERIRTQAHVISWAAHLAEKNWIDYTNWSDVLRGVAGESAAFV